MTVNVILSHRNHLRVSIFIQFEIVCEHTTEEDYISGSDVDVCFFFFANKKENKKNSFVFWRRTPMNIYWFHGRQKKNTENNTESDKNNGISFDAQKLLYSTNWNQFDSWKLVQVSQSNAIFWFFSFCFFFLQFDNLERRSKVFAAYFAYESIETHSFDHEEEESQTETFQQTDDGHLVNEQRMALVWFSVVIRVVASFFFLVCCRRASLWCWEKRREWTFHPIIWSLKRNCFMWEVGILLKSHEIQKQKTNN